MSTATTQPTPAQVLAYLEAVKDPEIPTVSLVDLGVVTQVEVAPTGHITVELTPTFAGCPAMALMQLEAQACLAQHGLTDVTVVLTRKPWTSDHITEQGRAALKAFGLSTPPPSTSWDPTGKIPTAECPRCGSHNTELKNPFGPTLCRSIHHCNDCLETFEQFKSV